MRYAATAVTSAAVSAIAASMAAVPRVASFHLVRDVSALRAMARLGPGRRGLGRVEGLRCWRLLGTGVGSSTGPGADLRGTALFAVWGDVDSLEAYHERMAASWARASEVWHVRLRGAGGHGTWRGVD